MTDENNTDAQLTDAPKAKEKKAGAPQAGLYLRIADDQPFEEAYRALREAAFVINRSSYEKNLHVLEVGGDALDVDSTDRLKALVLGGQQNGLVVIVRGDAGLAFAVEADGVLLDKPEDVANARAVMGEDAIIGLRCGLSRQLAEAAAAEGLVDYIAFAAIAAHILPPETLVGWWGARSEIPALVEGKFTNDDCGRYVRAGATFIEGSDYIWNHPKGIKQGTVDMLYAIDLAMESHGIQ
ncbi:MAG TPA: thiamine phosphate synthase [Micavibrio sp.]